jgi:hypothetical protein
MGCARCNDVAAIEAEQQRLIREYLAEPRPVVAKVAKTVLGGRRVVFTPMVELGAFGVHGQGRKSYRMMRRTTYAELQERLRRIEAADAPVTADAPA